MEKNSEILKFQEEKEDELRANANNYQKYQKVLVLARLMIIYNGGLCI